MIEYSAHRRVERLTVPRHFRGPGLGTGTVQLLDLSPAGARIEHQEHLHEDLVCYVDLPGAFGRLRLIGRVVWTRLHKGEQTLEGARHHYYQSGIVFIGVTPAQQGTLAAALEALKAARDAADDESTE